MIAVILAAGAGSRLGGLTGGKPKTLIEVDESRTILDVAVANLARAGVTRVVVVVGVAGDQIEARTEDLEARHGVGVSTIRSDAAPRRNNAYSLWLAAERLSNGGFVVNGDTLFPASVLDRLLEHRGDLDERANVLLAVDTRKQLGHEEMKVETNSSGQVHRINKQMDEAVAMGEYIGVSLVAPGAAANLAQSLEATWRSDPSAYYEDGYQHLVGAGQTIGVVPIGDVAWVEVDVPKDVDLDRSVACHC